ncbi:MAG: outer membrane lipoprotein carrier protein LolA [Bradymonadales bacterium]|nr:outer membrane lipoprotein carrier protein LolA [Bradymonadales bacterium]
MGKHLMVLVVWGLVQGMPGGDRLLAAALEGDQVERIEALPAELTQGENPPAEEPLSLDAVVGRVQAFYDNSLSYHADFEQIYTNIALDQDQTSSGHMYFLKPGRMRWDYQSPQPKYLVSDGTVLWMYEPEFNQVARLELANTEFPSALRFLMGEGVLAQEFDISPCPTAEEGAYCLHLVSRIGEGDYQYLEFLVDGVTFSVRETLVVDPIGNRNRFIFRNATTTDPLPEEGFQFTPPPDARFVTPEIQ